MTATAPQLGVDVRAARKAKRWTQEELAEAANLGSANTVIALEAGRNVRPGTVRAVCDVLGIDAESTPVVYPPVVRFTLDRLAAWMMTLPEDELYEVPSGLARWMTEWSQGQQAER